MKENEQCNHISLNTQKKFCNGDSESLEIVIKAPEVEGRFH